MEAAVQQFEVACQRLQSDPMVRFLGVGFPLLQ